MTNTVRWAVIGVACITISSGRPLLPAAASKADNDSGRLPEVLANDNRATAGVLRDSVLTIELVAAAGIWFPEGDDGPPHEIYAFGTEAGKLSNPGPLLRVPVGTEFRATIRNAIEGSPLVVHGLRREPGVPDTLHVPAGGTREVRFSMSSPGTYFYWATTRDAPTVRDRFGPESQLIGALIVDPPGEVPSDHVFVIGIEDEAGAMPVDRPLRAAVVNGRSWPHSLSYTVHTGDTVRMRWINATDRLHPMHLHGFYFRVDSKGDLRGDTIYDAPGRRLAVTELMLPGQTMSVMWVAERPGNWLMHCHMAQHMSPSLRRGARPAAHDAHSGNHTLEAMAGIVTGWRVLPGRTRPVPAERSEPRRLRLLVQSAPGVYGSDPGLGFVLQNGTSPPHPDSVVIPGAPLVLARDEPVEIMVVNRLSEPTSIHWHGIELDSYFDGVSGWSGEPGRTAPHVQPGDSFAVRFTPPRAGTFIYHSHFAEERQLGSGLYGALIVLEPGESYDPGRDRIWLLSQSGPGEHKPVMLNGSVEPVIELDAMKTYRIRLININPNVPLILSVVADSAPVRWRMVAKDGADLPPAQARVQPAVQRIGVGETYDFEFTPDVARDFRLRAVDPGGRLRLSGVVRVQGAAQIVR